MKKRAMKKWIPKNCLYCHDDDLNYCKWLVPMKAASARTKCKTCDTGCADQHKDPCPYNEETAACRYMNVVQTGLLSPLTDACRICKPTTYEFPHVPRRRQYFRYWRKHPLF